jgi:S-disulfanyl-L-cysteine oxidoreductase SoxD
MQYSQPKALARTFATALMMIVAAACVAAGQTGQAPNAAAHSTLRGAYTEAQAARGEASYRANCTSCHAPGTHAGDAFIRGWDGRTAFDLFELIRTTMPLDNPGRLSREQYVDVVAYLFKLNRLPPGDRALPADDEGLKQVRIEAKPTPAP